MSKDSFDLDGLYEDFANPHVLEVLNRAVPAISLNKDLIITSATESASRFFSVPVDKLVGQSLEVLMEVAPTWPWVPWVTSESTNALLIGLLDETIEQGSAQRNINVLTETQMVYKGTLSAFFVPSTEHYYLILNIFDAVSPQRFEFSATTITNKGEVKGLRGVPHSPGDIQLVKAYCEEDNIDAVAHRVGLSKATVERRLRRICERMGIPNVRKLVSALASQWLTGMPAAENTLRMPGCLGLFDHQRFENLPAKALPEERVYLRFVENKNRSKL